LAVRDNVIFELGLFMGRLGKQRCFFVVPRGKQRLRLPTDLLGVTPADYNDGTANLRAALGPATTKIISQIARVLADAASGAARRAVPPLREPTPEQLANVERLKHFVAADQSFEEVLEGGSRIKTVEIIRLVADAPTLRPDGLVTLTPEQAQAAEALPPPFVNDAHAVLSSVNWKDTPVVIEFKATDYMGVCAISDGGRKPVEVLSSNVVVFCAERRELYLHRRSKDARTYPNCLHTYGGAYVPPGVSSRDDALDLIKTARREIMEELDLCLRVNKSTPILLCRELKTGFIQFVLLGVDVDADEAAAMKTNWEGDKVVVGFDELPQRLTAEERWVPTGKAHVMAWLALAAPNAGGDVSFGGQTPQELFDSVLRKAAGPRKRGGSASRRTRP
jgi:hypothetical protein